MRLICRTSAVVVIASTLTAWSAAAEPDRGYLCDVNWVSKQGVSASALWLFRSREPRYETSMLASAPSGRRYVFTDTLDAGSGTMRTRLTHDESGWWIELSRDLGIRRPGVNALIQAFDPENLPADHKITFVLKTSESTSLPPTLVRYVDGNEHEALAAQLSDSPLRTAILKEAPAGMAGDLGFFAAAFTIENEYGFEFRSVVFVLRALLGGNGSAAPVTAHASRPVRGTALTDRNRHAFARSFRTVADPADPMPMPR